MQTHTSADVSVTLSDADIERLLEEGEIEEDGITIQFYGGESVK